MAVVAALAVGGTLLVGASRSADSFSASASVAPLPAFAFEQELIDRTTDQTYNPNQEFIFPSVFHAGKYFPEPLAEWYLYYAPHDVPGGISLMYSDSLDGPWTPFSENPIITNEWDGQYSVSHVSSPDALWNAGEGQMFLYFHGENDVTRFATTHDGIHFEYGAAAVSAEMVGDDITEVSYARVFDNPDRTSTDRYAMFFMTNETSGIRRIHVARSVDGRTWRPDTSPLINPGEMEGENVSSADLWSYQGRRYVAYGASSGSVLVRDVNEALDAVGKPAKLYVPDQAAPESGRATSPDLVADESGRWHLFLEVGQRSTTTIAEALSR
ncbi:MAG: hypothetical protein ABWY23_11070 [Mycetocola sp.]